jgi:MMPL family
MVFAFLFGLSMDYEVFILTRIREAYDASGDARHAVAEGLGRTGRLVTSAAASLRLLRLPWLLFPACWHNPDRAAEPTMGGQRERVPGQLRPG